MGIRNQADAKAAVARLSDAMERKDAKGVAAALKEINEVSPAAAERAIEAIARRARR